MRTVRPGLRACMLRDCGGRAWRAAPLLLGAVLVLASCSGGGGGEGVVAPTTSGQAPTTAAATTTSGPSEADTEAVLAAYRAFWDDIIAVGRTADWQSPRLAEHATGSALRQLRAQFREVKARGWIAKGTVKVDPVVASMTATRATIRDCVDTTGYGRYDPNAGRWIDPPGGQPDAERVQLIFSDGWKVADTMVTGPC
jgi:hypothetical protein